MYESLATAAAVGNVKMRFRLQRHSKKKSTMITIRSGGFCALARDSFEAELDEGKAAKDVLQVYLEDAIAGKKLRNPTAGFQ